MKKLIFALGLISVINIAEAQIKIGLRAAPQLTWSSPDNKSTTTNGTRVNIGYGLMLDYYFTENYAIGTEFTLQSMATNLNLSASKFDSIYHKFPKKTYKSTEDLKYDYRMRYLQIPILLKMRTKNIGNMRYFAEFGVGMNILTKAKASVSMGTFELDNVNINSPDEEDEFSIQPNDYDDGVANFRTGLIMGGGIQYGLSGESILVAGIRYDNAFSNFTRDDKWSTKLNYIALNIGILF